MGKSNINLEKVLTKELVNLEIKDCNTFPTSLANTSEANKEGKRDFNGVT